jgi:cytoplasmic iron level regulating protein YaaA (DUF328/UPF0246 family)
VRDAIGDSAPIDHYTGVLYKALDVAAWSAPERRWALNHLLIHDKDAGIVAAGSWEPVDLATLPGLVVDARSKEYVRLVAPSPSAITLRVVSEDAAGRRLAISHWNKHHKGVLARALVAARPTIRTLPALLTWAPTAALRLDRTGPTTLDLIT